MPNYWTILPLEVAEQILELLDIYSTEALEQSCRALHKLIIGQDHVWKDIYERDQIWTKMCYERLAQRHVCAIWLRVYGIRTRLECWWRNGTSAHLEIRKQWSLPLKRPADVKLSSSIDWFLASNGRKTCLIGPKQPGLKMPKLWWLTSSAAESTYGLNADIEGPMKIRTTALNQHYAAVKFSLLNGNYGKLCVWRIADRQCILSRTVRGFVHDLDLSGRWLAYFEDKGEREHGHDRIVVVDLAATPQPRIFRLLSPAFAAEGHLQHTDETSATFFHAYYSGQKYRWRMYLLTSDGIGKMIQDELFPPLRIYPGHATARRIESDHDRVLVYGRGDHRLGFTAWMRVVQLSENRIVWELDVGYTVADDVDAVQLGQDQLVWPFGHRGVKIINLKNGELQHYVDFGSQHLSSLLLEPIIGSLVLVGIVPNQDETSGQDWCLLLDVATGDLIRGPTTTHTQMNRRCTFSVHPMGMITWDGKALQDTWIQGPSILHQCRQQPNKLIEPNITFNTI
jgi:hypothetical protein